MSPHQLEPAPILVLQTPRRLALDGEPRRRGPAARAPRHKERVRSTGVRADAERVPRTGVLGPRTLPSLGVVVIGLGVLMRDLLVALLGAPLGAIGVATILVIGNLAVETAKRLL
jgi:hypothetical protein